MSIELSHRQEEIIQSAGKIMTEKGISGLTIKNLSHEMGFSEAALYRHFKSKEEIIITMLEFLEESMNSRFKVSTEGNRTAEEKFKELFRNQFEFFEKQPYFVVAIFPDSLMGESPKINETIFKIMQVKIKYLMPVIMQGQQTGEFTNAITSEQLIHIVMGAFRLQMFKWRMNKFQFDIKMNGEQMIHAILTLITNK